jgi:hypothetical protein
MKDLGVFFYSKSYFHNHVDIIFSECMKLLGLIRCVIFTLFPLGCLYVLYFTLVRSNLEHASVVGNSITSTDVNKLERIQKEVCVGFYCFFPRVPYNYTSALEKWVYVYIIYVKGDFTSYLRIVAFIPALPSWKMLVFLILLAVLGTSQSLVFVPLLNTVLLLCTPMLTTWWVKISTYLQSERFPCHIL